MTNLNEDQMRKALLAIKITFGIGVCAGALVTTILFLTVNAILGA